MGLSLCLLIVFQASLILPSWSVCPVNKFQIDTTSTTCTTDTCMGVCHDVFTCCVDLCFPLEITTDLTEACDIDTATGDKTCSQHVDEMKCLANMANSSPLICHEQLIWMESEGIASFASSSMYDCPCERGYHPVGVVCTFDLCKNSTDCVNTTDPFSNTDICCYNDYLKPTDDICDVGEELVVTVITNNQTDCGDSCTTSGHNYTCRTSGHTFPACCGTKRSTQGGETNNSLELADGVVVALAIVLSLVVVGFAVVVGIILCKRKYMKTIVDDKQKIGLESIEEVSQEENWINIESVDDDLDVDKIERSVSANPVNNTVEVTADINAYDNNRANTTTALGEGSNVFHDSKELFNKRLEINGNNTVGNCINRDDEPDKSNREKDAVKSRQETHIEMFLTRDSELVAEDLNVKKETNQISQLTKHFDKNTNSIGPKDDTYKNSSAKSSVDQSNSGSDLDTSFESEFGFHLASNSTADKSRRTQTLLSLVFTASLGDATDDNMSMADV